MVSRVCAIFGVGLWVTGCIAALEIQSMVDWEDFWRNAGFVGKLSGPSA
jgi:hypothetical protein